MGEGIWEDLEGGEEWKEASYRVLRNDGKEREGAESEGMAKREQGRDREDGYEEQDDVTG